ncbi:MAG: AMP-binding protein, partial [Actinomycetes bacterium]
MLLHDIVAQAAEQCPDRLALQFDDQQWTFAALHAAVERVARWLTTLAAAGERVVVVSDNRPEIVALLYAAPRAGLVLTFGNTRHTADELGELIATTEPAVLVSTNEQLARLARLDGTAPLIVSLDEVSLLDPPGADSEPCDVHEDDCAWLIYTSGSTGTPKGVMLTHRSLLAAVDNTVAARPLAPDDVYLFCFPLFHVAAYNVLVAHRAQRPVVLLRRFDADRVADAVRSASVTVASFAPTMISSLLDGPGPEALGPLRQISYGASAMPTGLLRRCIDEIPWCGLAQGYGMTELSGNAVFLDAEDHRRSVTDRPGLLGAAGRPGPLVDVRIIDEAGAVVATDAVGEVAVTGDQVSPGYWDNEDATTGARITDADGRTWFRTGDVGYLNDDGYLFIVDRAKDLVITGGENVSSREVEDLLSAHPDVAAVAVVGLPDDHWGERVCAVVVRRTDCATTPDDLVEWTAGRIAGFKRPKEVVTSRQSTIPARA